MKRWFLFSMTILFIFFSRTHCNSTAVQLTQIPITGGSINAPGTYYVGYDITGGITIAADRVTLNLNGHTVRNIIMENRDNVRITNGIVDSSTALAPTVSAGISISDCTNIHLSNLKVLYAGSTSNVIRGIHIEGGHSLFLSYILVRGFPSTGCKIEGVPLLVLISDCEFNKNGSAPNNVTTASDRAGLFINVETTAVVASVKRCVATGNRTDGFSVVNRSLEPTVWFFDCISSDNGLATGLTNSLSNGFHGTQASETTLTAPGNFAAIRCIAENNANCGFFVESRTRFLFENCLAYHNHSDGFFAEGDSGDSNSLGNVKECTSMSNFECGFNNNGPNNNQQPVTYVANFSHANNFGYCLGGTPTTNFPYCVRQSSEDQAQFWRNTQP